MLTFDLIILFVAGNQMMMSEAKDHCFRHGPHVCDEPNISACLTFCQDACKNKQANGRCLDDKSCFCYCCPQ